MSTNTQNQSEIKNDAQDWDKYSDTDEKNKSLEVYNENELKYLDYYLPHVQNAFDEEELYDIILDCKFEDQEIEKTIKERIRYVNAKGVQYGWNVVDKNHRLKPVDADEHLKEKEREKKLEEQEKNKVQYKGGYKNNKGGYNKNNFGYNSYDNNYENDYESNFYSGRGGNRNYQKNKSANYNNEDNYANEYTEETYTNGNKTYNKKYSKDYTTNTYDNYNNSSYSSYGNKSGYKNYSTLNNNKSSYNTGNYKSYDNNTYNYTYDKNGYQNYNDYKNGYQNYNTNNSYGNYNDGYGYGKYNYISKYQQKRRPGTYKKGYNNNYNNSYNNSYNNNYKAYGNYENSNFNNYDSYGYNKQGDYEYTNINTNVKPNYSHKQKGDLVELTEFIPILNSRSAESTKEDVVESKQHKEDLLENKDNKEITNSKINNIVSSQNNFEMKRENKEEKTYVNNFHNNFNNKNSHNNHNTTSHQYSISQINTNEEHYINTTSNDKEEDIEEINVNKTDIENLRSYFERLKQYTIFSDNSTTQTSNNNEGGIYEKFSNFAGSTLPVFQKGNLHNSNLNQNERTTNFTNNSNTNNMSKLLNNLSINNSQFLEITSSGSKMETEHDGKKIVNFSLFISGSDKKNKESENNTNVIPTPTQNTPYLNYPYGINPNPNFQQPINPYGGYDYTTMQNQQRYAYGGEGVTQGEMYTQPNYEYSQYGYYQMPQYRTNTNMYPGYQNMNYGNYLERMNYPQQQSGEMYNPYSYPNITPQNVIPNSTQPNTNMNMMGYSYPQQYNPYVVPTTKK